MTSEILAVPENHLNEVIEIIRAGLDARVLSHPEVEEQLRKWCNEEEEYLRRLREDS